MIHIYLYFIGKVNGLEYTDHHAIAFNFKKDSNMYEIVDTTENVFLYPREAIDSINYYTEEGFEQ